jgi:hypothetical protein
MLLQETAWWLSLVFLIFLIGDKFVVRQPLSRWREFSSALHQVQQAIQLHLPLKETLFSWNEIARAL